MRMMETIRQKGSAWLIGFLAFFLVSVFAGLGISGGFSFGNLQRDSNPDQEVAPRPTLSTQTTAVMSVNGRPVGQARFNTYVRRVLDSVRQQKNDPSFILDVYAYASIQLIQEEIVAEMGEKLGVQVTGEDIAEAKASAIAPFMPEESGASGNIVTDMTKGLGASRNRKSAMKEYLSRSGVSEQEWKTRVKRELLLSNTIDTIQDNADNEALLKSEETKVLVDEALAGGEVFQEVAREYSDDENAERGGDVGTWIRRGFLFNEEIEDVLYSLEKGETSDWFEVEVGYQKFKVYARKETSDPEFEDAREGVIERLMVGKDEGYEPTEEEIAEEYLEIKYYFIQLNTSDQGAAGTQVADLIEAAKIEINDPYILAHQALNGDRLQPPAGWTIADLEKIAKDSKYAEGYDFTLIADKLAMGKPGSATASKEEEGEEELDGADDGDAQLAEDAEAEAEAEDPEVPGLPETAEPPADYPIYALGVGLLQLALGEQDEDSPAETNYLIANAYLDWLADDEQSSAQPLNRTAAREVAEANLVRAVSRYNYSPEVYAKRGLNLAWLDRVDEAKETLADAEKYAPSTSGGVWEMIREGYEILDDQAAIDSIDERVTQWRQAELKAQIEKQQAASLQSQQPITFNFDDLPALDGEGTGDTEDAGETEPAASEDGADAEGSDETEE